MIVDVRILSLYTYDCVSIHLCMYLCLSIRNSIPYVFLQVICGDDRTPIHSVPQAFSPQTGNGVSHYVKVVMRLCYCKSAWVSVL